MDINNDSILLQNEQETLAGEFEYNYSIYLKGINISKYIGSAISVKIPVEIDGKPVVSIGSGAFHESNIINCFIPDSVTDISSSAFYDCKKLKNIRLSNSIKKIYQYTFFGCNELENITIPNGVIKIDSAAFGNCISLKNLFIPDSVKEIEFSAFKGCKFIPNKILELDNEKKERWNLNQKYCIELANKLLNLIINNNFNLSDNEIQNLSKDLFDIMLKELEPAIKIINSIEITGSNRKTYRYTAVKGDLCGGSEWEVDVESLAMFCIEDDKVYKLIDISGGYSR